MSFDILLSVLTLVIITILFFSLLSRASKSSKSGSDYTLMFITLGPVDFLSNPDN